MLVRLPVGFELCALDRCRSRVGDEAGKPDDLADLEIGIIVIEGREVERQRAVEKPGLQPDFIGIKLFGIELVAARVEVEAARLVAF